MFRSARRPVVYPQAEHALFSGQMAAAWGNDASPRPPLPFASFVRGVALHDRGYGELDVDEIGAVAPERWVAIQRAGFGERDHDPIVDLVVSMHVRRLVSHFPGPEAEAAYEEMGAALPHLHERAGVDESTARAADAITDLCDAIAFDVCRESPADGRVEIEGATVRYAYDGSSTVSVEPWPFAREPLVVLLAGYLGDGYPDRLERVVEPIGFRPS
jgi:hypothetical protein